MKDFKQMGKVLIPLSLMAMNGAFADEIAGNCCPTINCCPTDCCKPCCVPQPKKCIDCECYNPQYYDLQCDWGLFASVDFLYWYASESNLEYANLIEYTPQPLRPDGFLNNSLGYITQHKYVKAKWAPGVRLAIGLNMDCDGWDLLLNWTSLDNKSHASASQAQFTANTDLNVDDVASGVNNPWASSIGTLGFTQVNAPRVSAKWSLSFNQMDLEFGRKFWVSKCMTIRPYTGLRGAWTHTNFRVTANLVNSPSGTFANPTINNGINTNKFRNRFWGVGILGGLQPEFMFGSWCGCGMFSLYGNVEGALIWGKYRARNSLRFTNASATQQGVVTNLAADPVERDHYSRMQGILDLAIGLRWENHWCCDRYSTAIDLGWEHHYWFEYGLYHRTLNGAVIQTPGNFQPNLTTPIGTNNFNTNLGLGGLVIRFRLDF